MLAVKLLMLLAWSADVALAIVVVAATATPKSVDFALAIVGTAAAAATLESADFALAIVLVATAAATAAAGSAPSRALALAFKIFSRASGGI